MTSYVYDAAAARPARLEMEAYAYSTEVQQMFQVCFGRDGSREAARQAPQQPAQVRALRCVVRRAATYARPPAADQRRGPVCTPRTQTMIADVMQTQPADAVAYCIEWLQKEQARRRDAGERAAAAAAAAEEDEAAGSGSGDDQGGSS